MEKVSTNFKTIFRHSCQINNNLSFNFNVGISVGTDNSLPQDDKLVIHDSANSILDAVTSKMLTLRNAYNFRKDTKHWSKETTEHAILCLYGALEVGLIVAAI